MTAGPAFPPRESRAAGIWTLVGSDPIIAEPGGPATLLVPTEQVALLAVDLPVNGRARRLAALPFAIEERIAEPIESVHLALGAEIAPRRFLVGVVRREVMDEWTARADAAGLGHAAMVPDALALPVPPEDCWSVDLEGARAVVRAGDGTGFACPASLLLAAWQAAGRPPVTAHGAPLPAEMLAGEGASEALSARLARPALDLRQGAYAARASAGGVWRRIGWIVALGVAAHLVIALADTFMLGRIAASREAETRALVAQMAPGVALGEDVAAGVAAMLPGGGGGAPQSFLPLANRVFAALAPLGTIGLSAMEFQGETLTLDFAPAAPDLAGRLRAAFAAAGVKANVAESPDGSIRVTASAR